MEFSIKLQNGISFIQQYPMGKFIHVFDETTDNKVLSFFHSFNNALFKDLCEFDKTLQNKELSFFSFIHSFKNTLSKKKKIAYVRP